MNEIVVTGKHDIPAVKEEMQNVFLFIYINSVLVAKEIQQNVKIC